MMLKGHNEFRCAPAVCSGRGYRLAVPGVLGADELDGLLGVDLEHALQDLIESALVELRLLLEPDGLVNLAIVALVDNGLLEDVEPAL